MNTHEKLEKIKAKCNEIIALGEKRTRGAWWDVETRNGEIMVRAGSPTHTGSDLCEINESDAAFIAALAGPAEAMARSLLVAIDNLERLSAAQRSVAGDAAIFDLGTILAAWPDELF